MKRKRSESKEAAPASSAESPGSWIPDKLASVTHISEKRGDRVGGNDGSLRDWLPTGSAASSPAAPVDAPAPEESPASLEVATNDLPAVQDGPEERLRQASDERLRRAEERLREADRLLQRAEERARDAENRGERIATDLEDLEHQLADRARSVAAASEAARKRVAEAEEVARHSRDVANAPLPEAPVAAPRQPALKPRKRTPPDGKVDLNEASFETLRDLGLSVTQSARLVSQRDQRRGFNSLDELDAVWGMPLDVLETLKQKTYV